jgi:hypothetical protein
MQRAKCVNSSQHHAGPVTFRYDRKCLSGEEVTRDDEEKEKHEKQERHEEKKVVCRLFTGYGVEGGNTSSTPISSRSADLRRLPRSASPVQILSHMCPASIILR